MGNAGWAFYDNGRLVSKHKSVQAYKNAYAKYKAAHPDAKLTTAQIPWTHRSRNRG